MKSKFLFAAVAAALTVPAALPIEASAKQRVYRESQREYRGRCHRTNGETGLIAGGAGGALVGNAVGGGLLGTVAGGVGGALLGRHIDKRSTRASNARKGCYRR